MTAGVDQNDGDEPGGESGPGAIRWLSELLKWPASGTYLPSDEIERWVALSRGGSFPEEDNSDLELILSLASRPSDWRWMGIALLVLPSVAGSLGQAVRQLGRKGLRRLLAMTGRRPINLDGAIAFIDQQLIAGASPADIDFSAYSSGFLAWQGDGIRFALSVLGRVHRPVLKAKTTPALVRRQSSGGAAHRPSSGTAPASFLESRLQLPDLPLADLRDAPSVMEVPSSGDDEAAWTEKDFGGSLIYENWIAEHCADLHLAGALIPGTDRAFLRIEAQALGERLEQVMVSSGGDPLLYLTALAYSLSILTSEPRQSVVGAMARLAMGRTDSSRVAWLEQKRFRVRVPGADEFGGIVERSEGARPPCLQEYWLPLPTLVTTRLAALGEVDPRIWHYSKEGWDIHFDRLKSHLRSSTARFSEVRLRNVLPVAIWMQSADIIKAQILTGQLLDHPSAALHYYAFLLRDLQETYRESIAPWVPTAWGFAEKDFGVEDASTLVGAPRAAIADSAINAAIRALAGRCRQTFAQRGNDLHSLIRAYNEFVTYTAGMFAEAVASRLTYHLGLLSRRDFILPDGGERTEGAYAGGNGLVVFTDKHSNHGLNFRAAALAPVAAQQIQALLDFTAYLAKRLMDFSGGREVSLALQRVLSGERALFQRFKRVEAVPGKLGYRLVRYKRRDFADLWPEIPMPVEHLRHRFTTVARQSGLTPADIRIQMGHSMDYMPFGPTDPDSPLKFVNRVAPLLEAGLKRDGWQTIGVSIFGKAPALEPLNSDAIQRLDALLSKRFESRWSRYRQAIAREASQFRSEIEAAVAGLSSDQAVPAGAVLSAGDVSRVEKKLKKQYADSGRWPAVSHAFRIWIRQEVASGNVRAEVPRATFYRDPKVPAITPAATRAYHSACSILRVAEKLDTSSPGGESKGGAEAPTDNQISLAVVGLSVRAGLTQPDRLLAGIQALGSAESYGSSADQVVLRLENRRLDDRTDSASEGSQAEGFLLTGNAALLALSWKARFGQSTASVTAGSVRKAVSNFRVAQQANKPSRLRAELESILTTAVLARRLTVSGVRSAFEEGRICSRSFEPSREQLLRDGAWLSPALRIASVEESGVVVAGRSAPKVERDEEFVRGMRKNLHQWLRRKKKMTHDEAATRLEGMLAASPECGGTSAVFVRLVVRWLRGGDLEWRRRSSTVYTYLSLLVTPTFARLNGRDLLQLDAEEIEEIVQQIFFGKRVGNHKRMHMVLSHFLQVIAELGGATIEEDPLAEWESPHMESQAKPYCLSAIEQAYAMTQLDYWREMSASDRAIAVDAGFRSSDISMAKYLLACAGMGMRVGESESRRKMDLLRTPGGSVLIVRPHRRSPLKTLASPRALVLEEHLSAASVDVILSTFESIKESESKLPASDATSVASAALRTIAQQDSARLQAGRHAVACAGFLAIFEGGSPYHGLPQPKWLAAFAGHPPAIQLLALARTLGQATPITTLSHYVHLIGYGTESDVGWPVPDGRGYAAHAMLSYGSFRTRLSRAKAGGDVGSVDGVLAALKLRPIPWWQLVSDTFEPVGLPAGNAGRSFMHQPLGQLLIDIARGASAAALLSRHGVSEERKADIAREALILQEHYRYYFFDADMKPTGGVPHWSSLQPFLQRCDVACLNENRWRDFLRVLERQTKLSAQLLITGNHVIAPIKEILESIFKVRTRQEPAGADGCLALSAMFRQGGVAGQARASIVFVYFVCLLAERINAARSTS